MKIIEALQKSMLFSGLEEEQLHQLAGITHTKTYERGENIFFEGDQANGFYMAVSGKIKVFKMSFEGKEQILHIFGPGEPFGEVPVFHGTPYPASALALKQSQVLFFPRDKFIALVHGTPSLAMSMLAVLSIRLRRFATQIENLTLKEVPGRLASYLLYLIEEQGQDDWVELDIPKGQLANLLGASPETLSRIFARMSDEKLIRVEGKKIFILDLEKLKER